MFSNIINEFKKFAVRGSVIDLAVGVVIGGAFGKIVDSLVKDIIMPPIGLILHRVDFSTLFISLSGQEFASLAEAQAAGAPTLNYGLFINALISFLIIAFALFLTIKQINRLKNVESETPRQKPCPYCHTRIPLKATRCPACTSQLGK